MKLRTKLILACCSLVFLIVTFLRLSVSQSIDLDPPSSVRLRARSPHELELTWRSPRIGAARVVIEQSAGRQAVFTPIEEVPADEITYLHQELTPATTYCYRLKSIIPDRDVNSSYSETSCLTTPDPGAEFVAERLARGIPNSGSQFYVASDGTPLGDGSIAKPWDLQTALNQPGAVKPGDMISLRSGVYKGTFVSRLRGQPDKPVIVRSLPSEWAKIDGGADLTAQVLTVHQPNVVFSNLEIFRSVFRRTQKQNRCGKTNGIVDIRAANVMFINSMVHDGAIGFSVFSGAPDAFLYGNLIYYNGWIATLAGDRVCDHGVYAQNKTGKKTISDNIIFQNFSVGLHVYGSAAAYLDRFELRGNVIFNNGNLVTSSKYKGGRNIWFGHEGKNPPVIRNPKLLENYTYYPRSKKETGSFYLNDSTVNAAVKRNYFVGGRLLRFGKHQNGFFQSNIILASGFIGNWKPVFEPQNAYFSWNEASPKPDAVVLRRNRFDPNRSHLIVYNFKKRSTVIVDVSRLGWQKGDLYDLHNAENYFNDVVRGVYDGSGTIEVPMVNHSIGTPVGWSEPVTSFPEFGVFVLIRK